MLDLPILVRIASMALGQSHDCSSVIEVILRDMVKIELNQHYNKAQQSAKLGWRTYPLNDHMMTSSNGNNFRVTGPLCGEFTGPGEFPTQRPVTRSFDVFFDLRLNKRLSKQPWGWWFETPSWSLWRQCNELLQIKPEMKENTPHLKISSVSQSIVIRWFTQFVFAVT